MKTENQNRRISRRVALLGAMALGLVAVHPLHAEDYHFNPEHKRAVNDAVEHLYDIRERRVLTNPADKERCERGIQHLKAFSEGLKEHGSFDTAKLDQGIDDIQKLLDTGHMPPHDRDVLNMDVSALHRIREHH